MFVRVTSITVPPLMTDMMIREFLPIASKMLRDAAHKKLGKYQPGWPHLVPETLRKKARGRRWAKRTRFAAMGRVYGPDIPLIDTGKMQASVKSWEAGRTAYAGADFPMQLHETGTQAMPARPVMGPTLDEQLEPIKDRLEVFLAGRI